MNTELSLMGWLEPPDHGLEELKGKIARRAFHKKAVAGSTALALIGFTTIAIFHDDLRFTAQGAPSNREWQAAISTQSERLRVINGAALELSNPDADTRIYLVSTMPDETAGESG